MTNTQTASYVANHIGGISSRPMSELEERESRLSQAIDALADSVEQIQNKIQRTLLPEPPEPVCTAQGDSEELRCAAASFLVNQERRIRELSRDLENLSGRCQL